MRIWGPGSDRRVLGEAYWKAPLAWNKKKSAGVRGEFENELVFCSSMADVFEDHPTTNAQRERLWKLIRKTPHLTWQLLTKRPENIIRFLPEDWSMWLYPNVWIGVSIENNDYVHRAEILKKGFEVAVRFISYEPALGPLLDIDLTEIGWLIYGGESGAHRRQDDPGWAELIQQKCKASGTAFFYKQASDYRPGLVPARWQGVQEFPMEKDDRDFDENRERRYQSAI